MYELIKLTENDYYIDCPAKIGVVRTDGNGVVLIDGGSDKDAGKKALRVLEENGRKPAAVFNTHSHADHIGGNRYLQERTGCRIFAKGIEAAYTKYPVLEPSGLFGGLPPAELRHKFLLAQPSDAQELTDEVLPAGMKTLPLPGHSPDMTGFLTADGTAFIADSLSSEQTLEKYRVGYMWDPETAIKTLEFIKTVQAKRFVPAHAAVTDDITALADRNIAAIRENFDTVLTLCAQPLTFERLLKKVFDTFGMPLTVQQYALVGSTLRGYLTNLSLQGRVTVTVSDNELVWQAV